MYPLGIRSLETTYPKSKKPSAECKKLTENSRKVSRITARELIDIWLHGVVRTVWVFPMPAAAFSVATDIDVFYFLSEMYFLPIIYYRDLFVTICCRLIRFVLCYIWLLELGRFIANFFVPIVGYMFVTLSIVEKLKICNKKCHFLYTQFKLFFVILRSLADPMTGFLIGCGYLIIICSAWIVIKCYDDMPVVLYMVFLLVWYLQPLHVQYCFPHWQK